MLLALFLAKVVEMTTTIERTDRQDMRTGAMDAAMVELSFQLYGRNIDVMQHTTHGRKIMESGRILDTSKPVLVSRNWKPQNTAVQVGNVTIGSDKLVVIAGPCSVESEQQMWDTAVAVKKSGAAMLRGGAFKPRTSPYSFQGFGEEGLRILKDVGMRLDMPVVSEILSPDQMEMFKRIGIDMIQIGARNAQNYDLISEVARSGTPMLLKRGPGSTLDEWMGAAEYALLRGNGNVVLCERGIRTFSNDMRYTLDIPAMFSMQSMTHLPIGADPSHAAGKVENVVPLTLAAAGVGVSFLLIEVHCNPKRALSDAEQQLNPAQFADLMERLRK